MTRAAVHHPVRRILVRTAAAAIILLALAAIAFLPFAGRYLVQQDPLEKADAIVVLAGGNVERWLEGVDLYREGWAPRIVISPGIIDEGEVQLRRMGIRYQSDADRARDAMIQMKVLPAAVDILPGSLDNTADEAAAVHELSVRAGWHRLLVVTSKYHTRRSQFAFAREFKETDVRILMRASRYDGATPERWWRRRGDVRYVTSELQKLVAYRLGLGK
jgi:uncharacterized SAM-binding protein YcdF (DUF218 family)